MYIYPTHHYIRMEITVLYLKFHSINCRFNGHKYLFTGSANASPVTKFVTIKSPTDAVKFSNIIQLSPKYWNQYK